MPHRRKKSPGSFQDKLGGVIERVTRTDTKPPVERNKPEQRPVSDPAELNNRLFEKAWRRDS